MIPKAIRASWARSGLRRWWRETVQYRWLRALRPSRKRGGPAGGATLTLAEADVLWPPDAQCLYCSGWHPMPGFGTCPRIKAMTFRPTGEPARVEFWAWGEWPVDEVTTPFQKAACIKYEEPTELEVAA